MVTLAAATLPGWSQTPTFTISTVAGNGNAGDSGDGGLATSAELNGPRGVTEDIFGNLYIAEFYGQRVRKVTPSGVIKTLAGNGTAGYSGDGGLATSAELNGPYRVTVDLAGNVYIPDSSNSRIRKVAPNGTITTIVGNGQSGYSGDGGPATDAALNYPEAVAFDSAGNYYVADEAGNVVRKVDTNGIITTAVGTGVPGYSGDGGPAASAELDGPVGVAVNAADLVEKLKSGSSLNGRNFKVHLDGLNLLPFFKADVKDSPRQDFLYWSDDGDLMALAIWTGAPGLNVPTGAAPPKVAPATPTDSNSCDPARVSLATRLYVPAPPPRGSAVRV